MVDMRTPGQTPEQTLDETDRCHMAQKLLQRGVLFTERQQQKDTPLKRNCPRRRLAVERLVLDTADFRRNPVNLLWSLS